MGVTTLKRFLLLAFLLAVAFEAFGETSNNRAIVQSYSVQISALLPFRPEELAPRGRRNLVQAYYDERISELEALRDPAYQALVMEQRPDLERFEPGSRFFHVPVTDFDGNIHDMAGEIPGVWHLEQLDTAVFRIADRIRIHPQNLQFPGQSGMVSALSLGGTAAQSGAHAYPGDFDYLEIYRVDAASPARAGALMAEAVAEFVGRSLKQPDYEFTRLRIMPLQQRMDEAADYDWSAQRILDPDQRDELARQISTLDGGRMNTDWRALAAGDRFFIIGKIISIDARHQESGRTLFRTEPRRANYQTAYFGTEIPEFHEQGTLGEFAQSMLGQVQYQLKNGHYLKTAKRAFNFCRTIGDLDCVDAVLPVFSSPSARVYHAHKVLEAVIEALDPQTPTRILTTSNARSQMETVAETIASYLPVVPGTLPERPASIARLIQEATAEFVADEAGMLKPDPELRDRLRLVNEFELVPAIELGLRAQVESVVERFIP